MKQTDYKAARYCLRQARVALESLRAQPWVRYTPSSTLLKYHPHQMKPCYKIFRYSKWRLPEDYIRIKDSILLTELKIEHMLKANKEWIDQMKLQQKVYNDKFIKI